MKVPRKHILEVERDDNSVAMLWLYLGYANYRVKAADTCGEYLQLVSRILNWRERASNPYVAIIE